MATGHTALARTQFLSALEAFTRANALRNKTSPEALLGMARASYGQGVFTESLRSADRALKYVAERPDVAAAIHYQRGLALTALATGPDDARLPDAERSFQAAAALDRQLSVAIYQRGAALLMAYRDAEGIAELKRFLSASHQGPEREAARQLIGEPRRARARFAAPQFSLTTPDGVTVDSRSLAGKVVVLDFWGTWCPPCRVNTPGLVTLYEQYKDEPLVFVGIGVAEKSVDAWRSYIDQHRMRWIHALDTGSPDDVAQVFRIDAVPDYIVIDGEGIIRARLQEWGPEGPVALEQSILKSLALSAAPQSRSVMAPRGFGHAVSPDGRSLAYIERGDIIVVDLQTRETRTLTARPAGDTNAPATQFAWARSGQEIFYHRRDTPGLDSELFAVTVSDGRSRVVAPRRPYRGIADSSPDGSSLLVWTSETEAMRQLAVLSLADGSTRTLREVNSVLAAFSVDGRLVAYEQRRAADGNGDIRLMSRDGSADRPLVASPADERFLGWTPDGKSIVYSSDAAGTNDIWIADVTGGLAHAEPRLLRKNVGEVTSLGISPAGDLFYRVWAKSQLYTLTLDRQSGTPTGRPTRLNVSNVGGHSAPVWSPDGTELVFKTRIRGDSPESASLTFMTVASNALRTIVPEMPRLEGRTEAGIPGWIDWSSAHRSLLVDGALYTFGPRPKGAYAVDPRDGEATMIVSKPEKTVSVNQAKWLAGGRSVVYLESWTAVVVRDLETGAERRIYDSGLTDPTLDSLAISPDRTTVAFRDHRQGRILAVPVTGGEALSVAKAKGPAGWPASSLAWTADSRHVIFSDAADGQQHELWRATISGGSPIKLGIATDREISELAMSPDGRTLVLVMADGEAPPGLRALDRLVPPVLSSTPGK